MNEGMLATDQAHAEVEDVEELGFCCWNVQDMAHYNAGKVGIRPWPESQVEYTEKCNRIDAALAACRGALGGLDVIALCEITRVAAEELRDRVFAGYKVLSMDLIDDKPDLSVALIYRADLGFAEFGPFAAFEVPAGTRPMAVIDLIRPDDRIRFVAVHWTPGFEQQSVIYQQTIAAQLRSFVYEFLTEETGTRQHTVIVGDFNTEPFEVVETHLHARRTRNWALSRGHYTDEDVKRVRLYNAGWRLLGERMPHDNDGETRNVAGTYYWKKHATWRTFDQVIVSGGLLTAEVPYLVETAISVFFNEHLVDTDGCPHKYAWNNGDPFGVSDHLPVLGKLIVPRSREPL